MCLQALRPQGKAGIRWHQLDCAVVPGARARDVLTFELAGESQGSARLWELLSSSTELHQNSARFQAGLGSM